MSICDKSAGYIPLLQTVTELIVCVIGSGDTCITSRHMKHVTEWSVCTLTRLTVSAHWQPATPAIFYFLYRHILLVKTWTSWLWSSSDIPDLHDSTSTYCYIVTVAATCVESYVTYTRPRSWCELFIWGILFTSLHWEPGRVTCSEYMFLKWN